MNARTRSDKSRAKQAIIIIILNSLACTFTLISYFKAISKLTSFEKHLFKIKTLEVIYCEQFSFYIAISEIFGDCTNSHVHFVVFIYTFFEIFWNAQEYQPISKFTIIILFLLKCIAIQKSKILEVQMSSMQVLPAICLKTKKFSFSKKTYCRFLGFLCFKDLLIGAVFRKKIYIIEKILFLINQFANTLDKNQTSGAIYTEILSVFAILVIKMTIITDLRPEVSFSQVLTFIVGIVYLFFICLHYTLRCLIIRKQEPKSRKSLLDE